MKPYKACSCRDPETKRLLGKKCPKLAQKGHGGWYARYEAPRTADGKRRQPRIGPFTTERECKAELARVISQDIRPAARDDRKITLGEYLEQRHAWRASEAETGALRPTTIEGDRHVINLYLSPGLGHIRLVDLTDQHIRDLYEAVRKLNRPEEAADRSELMRRLREARATRGPQRASRRPISEARVRRIHAVLVSALNDAVHVSRIISTNPASGVWRTKRGRRGTPRTRPLPWTDERVERWEKDGHVPSPVMVWTTAQTGAFLDFAEACEERLYPLFHLDAYWGPRRGELIALRWEDVSLEGRRIHIRHSQTIGEVGQTKTMAGTRQITIDEETARVLAAWRRRQIAERLHWGEAYQDSGRVFTYEDGRSLRPPYISRRFNMLLERHTMIRARAVKERQTAGWIATRHKTPIGAVRLALEQGPLPPIRFHDLRHGAATMLIAAGVDDKLVSDALGHASVAFTKDVYAVVAQELADDAARRIQDFIPRLRRPESAGAIPVPSIAAK